MAHSPTIMPPDLLNKVMNAITTERARLRAIRRLTIASCICAGALVSSVFVWNSFISELVVSGFGQYASIAFLDVRAALANWQDYFMSLLESFPFLNAAGLVAELVLLMLSIKFIIIYGKRIGSVRRFKTAVRNI